ncbi:hypothetical protein BDN72DRAFT_838240 [Pluteus cervinus]|uniref:Uncharacterized protein n=1 Tax=Pluteus cervinus TaxID=181527 RepID=A0ACD3AZP5_9AGAR|nr:hypothetical protein BDN72DRAFT_838240 [Pluteus cervinus]
MLPNSLRHLHLYWSPLESYEWLSSLSNVVWLHLSYSFANAGREVAVDTILNVLDGMPQLVSLELLYMFHSASPEVERISPITAQLQDLKLSDNLHTVIKFLPWLSFAPRFTIDIRLSESNAPAFSTNCPLLFTQLGHHLKASLMVIRIADFSLFRLGVTCFEGVGESPCLQLYSVLRIDDIDRSWIINAEELPLAAVEALTTDALCSAADWGNSRWHNIPTLRRLTLGNDQTSSAFLHHLVAEGQRSSEHIPFASLEELSLHGLNYGRNLKLRVQTTLAERMERGAKLRKLAFRDCKVSEDSIKQLSKVVDVVEQHTSEKKRAKKEKRTT